MTLLLATGNRKKAQELRRLLRGVRRIRLMDLDRFPDIAPVRETGSTFRANAVKKAVATSRQTILPVLAEDSGLQVWALGGRPGVRSARFAGSALQRLRGQAAKDRANVAKLLRLLAGVPPSRRQARFVCWMALAIGGRLIRTFQASCSGSIALEPHGRSGFGYDSVFIPRGYRKTFAQLGARVKNSRSHRVGAVAKFGAWLKTDPPAVPAG